MKTYDFVVLIAIGLMLGRVHIWSDTNMAMAIVMVFIYALYRGLIAEIKERK